MTYLLKSPYENELNLSAEFYPGDPEEKFVKNKEKFGDKWIWSNRKILYKFNSYGYRMEKELDEVNLSNYIAFFGCSFTTGTGLPLEETFSYITSKALRLDYVNGAIGGASVDFSFLNIIEMLSNDECRPKAIIINWPELTRNCYWTNDKLEFYLVNNPMAPFWKPAYTCFLLENSHINNRFAFYRKTISLLCKSLNIKIFEFTTYQSNLDQFLKDHKKITHIPLEQFQIPIVKTKVFDMDFINKYSARDIDLNILNQKDKKGNGSHPGIYFNKQVAETVINWIKND